jgi:hypothetical protein
MRKMRSYLRACALVTVERDMVYHTFLVEKIQRLYAELFSFHIQGFIHMPFREKNSLV